MIESIKSVASRLAYDMMTYYTGNQTGDVPGNLPDPYYWWEAGAMFGSLMDYYYYTDDSTYNDVVTQGMLFQKGPENDYMTPNQTKTTGNDDQAFWGMSAMAAAEQKFPDPPQGQPGWLALAQAVFNTQVDRWDNQHCGGGLRWQVFAFNNGYDYKNTISNGCFFNLGARLAMYTGNDTYMEWAVKAYDWTASVGFMTPDYHFYDGAHTTFNCTDINKVQWTYNVGVYILGAANMYNYTNGSDIWRDRLTNMINATSLFFVNNVMTEQACERPNNCNTDNFSFKAYLSRWLAATTKLAPFTFDTIMPLLRSSAQAAVAQCTGGASNTMCGMRWTDNGKWDGSMGVGQQMGVLEVVQANLVEQSAGPVTNSTGGTSRGDPSAGTGGTNPAKPLNESRIKGSDRAGAGILTTLVLVGLVGGVWWMIV